MITRRDILSKRFKPSACRREQYSIPVLLNAVTMTNKTGKYDALYDSRDLCSNDARQSVSPAPTAEFSAHPGLSDIRPTTGRYLGKPLDLVASKTASVGV